LKDASINRKSAFGNRQFLALLLLVLGVCADHAHGALAADDLAVLTDSTDARSDLHDARSPSTGGKSAQKGRIDFYSTIIPVPQAGGSSPQTHSTTTFSRRTSAADRLGKPGG
jgi:hypothetical protein